MFYANHCFTRLRQMIEGTKAGMKIPAFKIRMGLRKSELRSKKTGICRGANENRTN